MAATPSSSGAPWSDAISSDDHGPIVSITASLMLVGMLLSLMIRLAIRWPWKQLLGSDDLATIVASMFALGQTIAVYQAVYNGLGRITKDLELESVDNMEKAIYASNILFIFAVTGSKLALSLLVLRLASAPRHVLAARIITVLILIWGFAAVLAVAIRPSNSQPWRLTAGNASQLADAWTGIEATSILLEIAILVLPIFLVWDLQMAFESKLAVVVGFALRLPMSIVAILRIISLRTALSDTTEISWTYIVPTIFTEIEMHYALIAATIPCMRIFLKNFNTGWLGTTADQVDPTATMVATKGSNSYQLSSMGSQNPQPRSNTRAEKCGIYGGEDEMKLRGDDPVNITQIIHTDSGAETGSNASDGSDHITIRKTVHVDLGYGGK